MKKLVEAELDLGRYAGLGLQFVLIVALCGGLGWWLDSWLGSTPWLLVAGVLAGAVLAFITIVRSVPPPKSRAPGAAPEDPSKPDPPRS